MVRNIIASWVYWAVPTQIQPNMIADVTINDLGMLELNVEQGYDILGYDITQFDGYNLPYTKPYNIIVTPQAFLKWYDQYEQTISTLKDEKSFYFYYSYLKSTTLEDNKPIGAVAATIKYLIKENYIWIQYNKIIIDMVNYDDKATKPRVFGNDTTYLYALVKNIKAYPTNNFFNVFNPEKVAEYLTQLNKFNGSNQSDATKQVDASITGLQQQSQKLIYQGQKTINKNTSSGLQQQSKELKNASSALSKDLVGAGSALNKELNNALSAISKDLTEASSGLSKELDPLYELIKYAPYLIAGAGILIVSVIMITIYKKPAQVGKGVGNATRSMI